MKATETIKCLDLLIRSGCYLQCTDAGVEKRSDRTFSMSSPRGHEVWNADLVTLLFEKNKPKDALIEK